MCLRCSWGRQGIDEAYKERGLSPVEGRGFGVGHVARIQTIGETQVEVDSFVRGELGRELGWGGIGPAYAPPRTRVLIPLSAPKASRCSASLVGQLSAEQYAFYPRGWVFDP